MLRWKALVLICVLYSTFSEPSDVEQCSTLKDYSSGWLYEWCDRKSIRKMKLNDPRAEKSVLLGSFSFETRRNGHFTHTFTVDNDACRRKSIQVALKCCLKRYLVKVERINACEYKFKACTLCVSNPSVDKFNPERRKELANQVKSMFYHGYDNYIEHAFPHGTLKPISCRGSAFELGKLPMLTLIDTLDTLGVFRDAQEFQKAVKLLIQHADFDLDIEVSVFEITIRALGGLLSAHLMAIDTELNVMPREKYNNELLDLAIDLADRLLPAFETPTGIPYGTVNLRRGVPLNETTVASTAGAGSLTIEFTMLSQLSGNAVYSERSRGAVRAIFQRRSTLGLVGKHINIKTGKWVEYRSGPGSNSDSFYEYLLKMYILFDDQEALGMFETMYSAVMEYNSYGNTFADVSMWNGCSENDVVFENLMAFWPGMQCLVGDIAQASKMLNEIYQIWRQYGFISERFDLKLWKPYQQKENRYPLRPELIESTYYMFRTTRDDSWLQAGAEFLDSIEKYSRTSCGYASISDIIKMTQEDEMPSFFLSETCKYMYLLFEPDSIFHTGNYVFSTEAHPFKVKVPQTELSIDNKSIRVPVRFQKCVPLPFWIPSSYNINYIRAPVAPKKNNCRVPKASSHKNVLSLPKFGSFLVYEDSIGNHIVRQDTDSSVTLANIDSDLAVITYVSGEQLPRVTVYDTMTFKSYICSVAIGSAIVGCSIAQFDAFVNLNMFEAAGQFVIPTDLYGCTEPDQDYTDQIVVLQRGTCYFYEKARLAESSGAKAVVIINTDNNVFIMSGLSDEEEQVDTITIPVVMVPYIFADELVDDTIHVSFKAQGRPPKAELAYPKEGIRCYGFAGNIFIKTSEGYSIQRSTKKNQQTFRLYVENSKIA